MGLLDKIFGGDEDQQKIALIDSNHKLTGIIYTVFQSYQNSQTEMINEFKKLKEEHERIQKFLKEKYP